jgi:hypothetical protein
MLAKGPPAPIGKSAGVLMWVVMAIPVVKLAPVRVVPPRCRLFRC